MTLILGIETSCDETAASVVRDGRDVLSSVVSSQIDLHARFGGVVPEVASRAHVELLTPVVAEALVEAGVGGEQIDAVAATAGPGLIGSLLVGSQCRQGQRSVWDVRPTADRRQPLRGPRLRELADRSLEEPDLELPIVVLLVSGGHTLLIEVAEVGRYRVLGGTIDDAAGEAFDKVARFLGLGYPGGPVIDRQAVAGDPTAIRFPRAMLDEGLDLSFSGLKTSVINYVESRQASRRRDGRSCVRRSKRRWSTSWSPGRPVASRHVRVGAKGLALAGGVAANSQLRAPAQRLRGGRPARVPAEPGDVHRQRRDGGGDRVPPARLGRADIARRGCRSQPRHRCVGLDPRP